MFGKIVFQALWQDNGLSFKVYVHIHLSKMLECESYGQLSKYNSLEIIIDFYWN